MCCSWPSSSTTTCMTSAAARIQTITSGESEEANGISASASTAVATRSQKSIASQYGGMTSSTAASPIMESASPAQTSQPLSSYAASPPAARTGELHPDPQRSEPRDDRKFA